MPHLAISDQQLGQAVVVHVAYRDGADVLRRADRPHRNLCAEVKGGDHLPASRGAQALVVLPVLQVHRGQVHAEAGRPGPTVADRKRARRVCETETYKKDGATELLEFRASETEPRQVMIEKSLASERRTQRRAAPPYDAKGGFAAGFRRSGASGLIDGNRPICEILGASLDAGRPSLNRRQTGVAWLLSKSEASPSAVRPDPPDRRTVGGARMTSSGSRKTGSSSRR